jgi:hypothetical protein
VLSHSRRIPSWLAACDGSGATHWALCNWTLWNGRPLKYGTIPYSTAGCASWGVAISAEEAVKRFTRQWDTAG